LSVVPLLGCKTLEGKYSPGCIAYAGSNIELSNGNFSWEKFTDAVVIDDAGNVVNQFPGYPLQGSYRIEGQTLRMESASGEALSIMYFLQHGDREYLLTVEQFEALGETGEFDECALVLGGYQDNR
jgi:hypothetical protein